LSDGGEEDGPRILLEIAQQFAATLELAELVPLVLERVVSLLRAERALFVLLDAHQEIERAVTHNLPWPGPPAPLPVAQSLLLKVIRERALVVASSLDDGAAGSTDSMRRFGLRRVVVVPVLRRSHLVGVIYVDSSARGGDDVHAQAETLRALASLVGVAVENARLFDELRYRRDLLAWMVHDLRNPITAVSVNASLLLEGASGEARAMLREVESAAERSTRMVDWALALDRIDETTPGYPAAVDVGALVARSVLEHGALARQRGVSVEVEVGDGLAPVLSHADRIGVVLDNLLFNALKFAAAGSAVLVRVRRRGDVGPAPPPSASGRRGVKVFDRSRPVVHDDELGFVEVSVQNEGVPVPTDVRRRLFSRGAQGVRTNSGLPSNGLGLAIAYDCAQSLGGMLWLDSPDGARTTVFAFTVPSGA
jgi:signal transduction histidine kinase